MEPFFGGQYLFSDRLQPFKGGIGTNITNAHVIFATPQRNRYAVGNALPAVRTAIIFPRWISDGLPTDLVLRIS